MVMHCTSGAESISEVVPRNVPRRSAVRVPVAKKRAARNHRTTCLNDAHDFWRFVPERSSGWIKTDVHVLKTMARIGCNPNYCTCFFWNSHQKMTLQELQGLQFVGGKSSVWRLVNVGDDGVWPCRSYRRYEVDGWTLPFSIFVNDGAARGGERWFSRFSWFRVLMWATKNSLKGFRLGWSLEKLGSSPEDEEEWKRN